ncbi:MAG: hypothetical protein ACIAXF_09500 [Phycisphaerales bacterium JB063]
MTDEQKTKLAKGLRKELTEAEALERDLDRLFASLQPPYGAQNRLENRLMAILDPAQAFDESDLVLDGGADQGPYSFEQALAQQQAQDAETGSDLLAAGLEEEPIEETDAQVQPDAQNDDKNL